VSDERAPRAAGVECRDDPLDEIRKLMERFTLDDHRLVQRYVKGERDVVVVLVASFFGDLRDPEDFCAVLPTTVELLRQHREDVLAGLGRPYSPSSSPSCASHVLAFARERG
jgi:hypothetical protein